MALFAIFLVILFLTFLTYSGALYIPFGMSDDYYSLARVIQAGGKPVEWAAGPMEGRIVQGILLKTLWVPTSIPDFTRYRIVALVGFALFAFLIYLILSRHEKTPAAAAFVMLMIALIPFHLWLAWSMLFLVPYAACLAVAAALVIDRAIKASGAKKFLGLTVAVAIFWVALNIYQPAAMMFWVAAAMLIFLENSGLAAIIRRGIFYGASGFIGLGLSFTTMKVVQQLSGRSQIRTDLVSDLPGKLVWFLREPLLNALNFHDLTPSWITGGVLGLVILGGLLLFFKGSWLHKILSLLIAAGLALLAYLPNLIIAENWPTYRTLAAFAVILFFYLYLAVKQFYTLLAARIRWLHDRSDQIFNIGMVAAAAIGLLLTNQFFTQRIALPNYIEHRVIKNTLAAKNLAQAIQIDLIPPAWNDAVLPVVRYEEFGIPASFTRWGTEPTVRAVLAEINPAYFNIPIHIIASADESSSTPGTVLIDLRKLRNFRYP